MVFSCLHTIPRGGPVPDVEACGLHVHVDQVEGFRIVSATVRKCAPQEPPERRLPGLLTAGLPLSQRVVDSIPRLVACHLPCHLIG